ncbi:predicted protein [Postia placenta Mad-698-R]|nr:predicted protein [Postia placenta Mad-698-R]
MQSENKQSSGACSGGGGLGQLSATMRQQHGVHWPDIIRIAPMASIASIGILPITSIVVHYKGLIEALQEKSGFADVPMSEDSAVLDSLLRLCYPTRDPEFESLEKLRPVMEAAMKFLMEEPLRRLKERLLIFAVESPIRVYAIAIKCGWEEEARKAARCCLNYSIDWNESDIPELHEINGVAYHRILDYHRQCSAAAKDLCSDSYQWIDTQEQWAFLECGICIATQGQQIFKDNVRRTPRGWWTIYMGMFGVWLGSGPSGATFIKASQTWPIDDKPEIEAMTCKTCKGKIHRQMAAFSKKLAAEVDRVTAQIELKVEI